MWSGPKSVLSAHVHRLPSFRRALTIRSISGLLTLLLVLAACGSSESVTSEAPSETDAPATTDDVVEADSDEGQVASDAPMDRSQLADGENLLLDDIITAVAERPDVWDEFSLADIPTIVPRLDENDNMTSGFAFFHPNPQAAGDAVPLPGVEGLPDLHYIPQVRDIPKPEKLSFKFDAMVGGVETYIFPGDSILAGVFGNVMVHEAFHAFQLTRWDEGFVVDQQRYDLALTNYELALLEDQALVAAYNAVDDAAMTQSIRHFLALRETRRSEFPTTKLDGYQERFEGSAEWFERRHMGRDTVDAPYQNPNNDADLSDSAGFANGFAADFAGIAPLQRFYYSGATQYELLQRLGADWMSATEAGAVPADLLAAEIAIDPSNVDALVSEARQTYDPAGELSAVAEVWLTAEPGDEHYAEDGGAPEEIPQEIVDCLAGFGLVPEQIDADESLLTEEIQEACLGSFESDYLECVAEVLEISVEEAAAIELYPEETFDCFE